MTGKSTSIKKLYIYIKPKGFSFTKFHLRYILTNKSCTQTFSRLSRTRILFKQGYCIRVCLQVILVSRWILFKQGYYSNKDTSLQTSLLPNYTCKQVDIIQTRIPHSSLQGYKQGYCKVSEIIQTRILLLSQTFSRLSQTNPSLSFRNYTNKDTAFEFAVP